jgi:hypothetical protein
VVEGDGIIAVEQGRERKHTLSRVHIGREFDIWITNTR